MTVHLPHRLAGIPTALIYDWRTANCDCDGGHVHGYNTNGPITDYCDVCSATGEVTAACVECNRIVPLDAHGECEKCIDSASLPIDAFAAKWHPRVQVSA